MAKNFKALLLGSINAIEQSARSIDGKVYGFCAGEASFSSEACYLSQGPGGDGHLLGWRLPSSVAVKSARLLRANTWRGGPIGILVSSRIEP